MGSQIFSVVSKEGTKELHLHYDVLIAVGYGGRDQEKVKVKLAESAAKGKKVPSKTPINYPCSVNSLVRGEKIQVVGQKTKGEAEFILVLKDRKIYVGVGSDHTDSELTSISTNKAKQTCPKPMGPVLWPYEEVKDHWDQMKLLSWQRSGNVEKLYQEGFLAQIMKVEDILQVVAEDYPTLKNAIIFGGTVGVVGEAVYGEWFRCELEDPILDRKLSHEYQVEVLSNGKE